MPATLTTAAVERSTYVITLTYKDEDGNAVTPDSVSWTLTDGHGNIINSREDVAIAVPSTTNDVVLQGADLVCRGRKDETRILTASIVYDSSAGSNLPGKEQVSFRVENLQAVIS